MEVGIVQGGVRARVVERQIVRHLTHLIPYLTPSPVTTLIHPFLRYAFLQPDPLTLHTPFSPVPPLSLPLHRPPLPLPPLTLTSPAPLASSFSRQPPLRRRRLQSFRLPTPYKRSCCPFITTTPATTTTERPPPPHYLLRAPFHPSPFSTVRPFFSPSTTFDAHRPRISFVSSFCSQAPPRSLLTL